MTFRHTRIALYADALVHMHPRQALHRPRRLLPLRVLAAGLSERVPWRWYPVAAGLGVDPAPQSGPVPTPESSESFAAVGRRRAFVDSDTFWDPGPDGLLFAFHLHGFAQLARYAATPGDTAGDAFWISVIESWLRQHATPQMPGWHPYPTSGRVIAWCAALSRGRWPSDVELRMLRSLTLQAAVLGRSIEHDIGGNHVLRNATALLFAGVCLGVQGHERHALRLLERELGRQVLSDGGHEERSTAYHRSVLADVLDAESLLERVGRGAPNWLMASRQAMERWDRVMRGPDGTLPMLNDAWEGPSVPAAKSPGVTVLQPSGYVAFESGDDRAIFDVGPLAPEHLPPHAHSDLLSLVLWGDGQPLLVDPGSFEYTGPKRRAFRATSSHNTVEVDGVDQCELWGDFRAAFMPPPGPLDVQTRDGATIVTASHDGYRRLDDPVTHERTVLWLPSDGLVIVDALRASRIHRICSRLHLAVGLSGSSLRVGPFSVDALGSGATPSLTTGRYSPYLGVVHPIAVIEYALDVAPHVPFGWALLRPGASATMEDGCLRVRRVSGAIFDLELSAPGAVNARQIRSPILQLRPTRTSPA